MKNYEVYCRSFSKVIQADNAIIAAALFTTKEPFEEIITIENIEARNESYSKSNPEEVSKEEVLENNIDWTMHEEDRECILKAMDEWASIVTQSQLRKQEEEIKKLQSTCLAAAEEIQSKWDAHCDSEGYGPANLMRRLENGVGDWYRGYNAGQFERLQSQLQKVTEERDRLKEKVEFLEIEIDDLNNQIWEDGEANSV